MDIQKSNINNISSYLKRSEPTSVLGQIIEKAERIHLIQSSLDKELGSEFSGQVWIGQYEKGILSLLSESASLATKLRFSIPDIRDKLRKQPLWAGLKSIEVKILVTKPQTE